MQPSEFLRGKKVICCLLSSYFALANLNAQIAIELEKENVLVLGVENPITVIVSDVSDACLVLRPSGGVLEKHDNVGSYGWTQIPDTTFLTLEIIDTCKNELVAEKTYRIRDMQVNIGVGVAWQRTFTTDDFNRQWGIRANLTGEDGCGFLSVLGFSAEFFSKATGQVWKGHNEGSKFSGLMAEKCQTVMSGDWVRFYNISFHPPGRKKPVIIDTDLFFRIE